MQRQSDPASPDVLIGQAAEHNSSHRSWTLLGTVGDRAQCAIDPRGLVTASVGGPSIDWWVGADDRWHLPARSVGIRQRLVDDSPVVETTMRVPGGEVTHRAWAVAAGDGVPAGGAVVIEIHNGSAVPVAVAFAIRPFDPTGRISISRIDLDATSVLVDGHRALHLPRPPSRVAFGSAELGDALHMVESGTAGTDWPEDGVRCGAGRASATVLYPLPHTATIRVLVPLAPPSPRAPRWSRQAVPVDVGVSPSAAVDAARIVAGWEVQTRRCPRIELLERRAPDALRAARRFALLHAAGDDAESWSEGLLDVFDACSLIVALDQHGLHAEAARLLMGLDDRIDVDGRFEQEHQRIDAGASWLHAVARHVELADDVVLARSLAADIAKIAHRVHRDVLAAVGRRRPRHTRGPSWVEDPDAVRLHDLIWAHSALLCAQFALRTADQTAAASGIAGLAAEVLPLTLEALDRADAAPEVATAGVAALVESDSPLLLAHRARVAGLVDRVMSGSAGAAVWHAVSRAGFSPRLTAAIGTARARLGDPGAVHALRWMLEVGEPTWSWATVVHPRTGHGSGGDGHAPGSTATFLRLVRALAALDDDDGIDLLPVVPAEWLGQPVEVHDLPTRHGRLSFAIRWHGERPALLWDLIAQADPAIAAARGTPDPIRLRCSGLDPDWSTTDARGETLLAAPAISPEISPAIHSDTVSEEVGAGPVPVTDTDRGEPPVSGGSFS